MWKSLIILAFLIIMTASCQHLTTDTANNPAKFGHHRMEFDVNDGLSPERKELGIANINLMPGQTLDKVTVVVHGIETGSLSIISETCGINLTKSFNKNTTLKLGEMIAKPAKCSIKLIANTDPINNKQHEIVESGLIKLNITATSTAPIAMEYSRMNSFLSDTYQTYSYVGQGSMQRQEGDLTYNETAIFKTSQNESGVFRITGCDPKVLPYENTFTDGKFEVSIKDIYGGASKDYLTKEDTCDFEIVAIPNETPYSYYGRFSMSIFTKDVSKLENLNFSIKDGAFSKKIVASGSDYVLGCYINDNLTINKTCDTKYEDDKVYWLRAVTSKGRKSLIAVKNGELIWKE